MHKLRWLWPAPSIAIVLWFSWQMRRYQVDDALIYLRYVRNFVNGQGLVYNPGERFNGMTSPLFSYLLAVVGVVLRDHLTLVGAVVSTFGMLATVLLAGRLFSKSPMEACVTSTVVALTGFFYRTYGLETTLSLAFITLLLLLARVDSEWIFPVGALAVITRAELAFLVIPVGVAYLIRTRALPRWRFIGGALGLFFAPLVVNWSYYGHLLPGTAAAKFGQGMSGFWGTSLAFLHADYLFGWVFSGQWAAAIGISSLAIIGLAMVRAELATKLALIYLAGLGGFYLVTNMPNYHWYYAPFIYFLVVFVGTGLGRLMSIAAGLWRHRSLAGVVAALIVLASPFGLASLATLPTVRGLAYYREVGTWLKEHSARQASVAATEIGTLGWYSDRPVVDILGLVNDDNAGYIAQRDVYSWLYRDQPDYVLCHQPTWRIEASCDLLISLGLYRPAMSWDNPRLVLLERSPAVSAQQVAEAVRAKRPR